MWVGSDGGWVGVNNDVGQYVGTMLADEQGGGRVTVYAPDGRRAILMPD